MATSGGVPLLLFILFIQVFTEYVSAEDRVNQFSTGFQYPGSDPPDQYPGHQSSGFQSTFFYPHPPKPTFSEDDLTVLVGTDIEVPYPLYKQISESFLSTTNILVLLPNNTIVQVSGYVGLNDIAKADPDDTKVLISSDMMIPAAIYLRIVLIQPEEIMVRLPDGQILPNEIYQERYGKKVETQSKGGQTFFQRVSPKDSFSFLVINDPKKGLSFDKPPPPFISELVHHVFSPTGIQVPVDEVTLPVPLTPSPPQEPVPVPQYPEHKPIQYPEPVLHRPEPIPILHYPEPTPVPQYSEPKPVQYPEPIPVFHHPEPLPIPYYPEPVPVSEYPESKPIYYPEPMPAPHHPEPAPVPQFSDPKPSQPCLGSVRCPYYSESKSNLKYPGYVSNFHNLYYPESKKTPSRHPPRPSYQTQTPATCVESKRPASEQKALLPPGVHVMDTSRCKICDPTSEGVHVRVFNV